MLISPYIVIQLFSAFIFVFNDGLVIELINDIIVNSYANRLPVEQVF
jgi:hypothetical protein